MKLLLAPFRTLGLLGITLLVLTCVDDNAIQMTDLEGRWNIQSAIRDGEATGTLEGMYLIFDTDGQLLTNLTGSEEAYVYEIDGQKILQREGTIAADYTIESLVDDELVITTTFSSKPFRMTLKRESEE